MPRPVVSIRLPHSSIVIECYGKPINWHPDWGPDEHVAEVAKRHHVRTVYCPRIRDAAFADKTAFTSESAERVNGTTLLKGVYADATVLPRGAARIIASADCPTIVAWNGSQCLVSHAGRDSLIDPVRWGHTRGVREHESVADIVVTKLNGRMGPTAIWAFIGLGIRSGFIHSPEHPVYGEQNTKLLTYLRSRGWDSCVGDDCNLDLYELCKLQLAELGVPERQIIFDDFDTAQQDRVWSHRRGNPQRNLVFVARRS